jgi:hypothetical protein
MMQRQLFVMMLLVSTPALSETVTITASQDNTIYSANFDGPGSAVSNGAGENLFVGQVREGWFRRTLIAFKDLSDIPEGATIESVQLHIHVNKLNFISHTPMNLNLHRLTSDWGEGASNPPGPQGQGWDAEPGDATWTHSFFSETTWNSPGGDFASTASAQIMDAAAVDINSFGSTVAMVSDVQGWLDDPGSNFGWILIGEESGWNARRLSSRERAVDFTRPRLEIEYSGGTGGGFVMDAGIGGNWWNGPGRSGEGVQAEVADDGDGGLVFVATVYSYGPMGGQIFMIAFGPVVGDTATVDVFITDGGQWGDNFDPSQINETQWGTGTFKANSCDSMDMDLMPNAQYQSLGYTRLMYELVPLTTRAIACPLSGGNQTE